MLDDLHLRVALGALVAGALSALACAPWAASVVSSATSGASASVVALGIGLALAMASWTACGAWVAGERGRDAVAAAALAGGLSAGLGAAATWLPTIEVWSLDGLWSATRTGASGDALLKVVLADSVRSLVRWAISGWWMLVGLGAACAAVGAAIRAPARPMARPPALVWPVLLARAAVLVAMVGLVAVAPLGASGLDLRGPMLANAALLGCASAAAFTASGVGHLRSPSPASRVLALLYGLAGTLSVTLWLVVPSVAAPQVLRHPALALYLALPLLGAVAGAALGWGHPAREAPRWRAVLGESLLFSVAAAGAMFGPGAVSVGLAGALLPIAWIGGLGGLAPYPEIDPAVRGLFVLHWTYLPLALVAAVPMPLVASAVVVGLLRWFHGDRRSTFTAE